MTGGFEKKPGGESLVQRSSESATAGTPGKRTLTEQLGSGAGGAPPATYTVQPGESLAVIAGKLRTTVDALKAANAGKLKSYPTKHGTVQCFNAGEVLQVPGAAAASTPVTPDPAPAASSTPEPAGGGVIDGVLGAIGGALHDAWDYVTGGPSAPAPANDEHPAGDGKDSRHATSGDGAADNPADAPLAELDNAQRGEKLSTFHSDELGKIDKFGMSKTGRDAAKKRGQWLTAAEISKAGAGKKGAAFVDAADAVVGKTKFSEDQDKILASAKEFASSPKALTPEQEKKAVIDWGKAQLTLDGVSLNEDLKARLARYVRFLAWAGLVTGPTTVGSVMRSPQTAHKLAVGWMFNLGLNTSTGNTLHDPKNRQKLVATVTAKGGSDADGNTWMSPTTVEGLTAKKDDDDALFEYIKSVVAPEANQVQVQGAIAAEGYKTADKRHPNVLDGTFVSNHLLGEAVDIYPPFVFNNKFDPMIDAIAMYFGLWRAVKDVSSSPEHWHYERLGSPPGSEADSH